MNITKKLTIILAILVFSCCDSKSNTVHEKEASRVTDNISIGPQFGITNLPEFERVDDDVKRGLGGRWTTFRYQKKSSSNITKQELQNRFIESMKFDGWKSPALPTSKYVLSKIYETSEDDLCFSRNSRGKEPKHWFFNMVVHISDDANIVVLYCEVGW